MTTPGNDTSNEDAAELVVLKLTRAQAVKLAESLLDYNDAFVPGCRDSAYASDELRELRALVYAELTEQGCKLDW